MSLRDPSVVLIVGLAFLAATPEQLPGQQPTAEVDADFARETVRSLAAVVEREYFDPDLGALVGQTLRLWLDKGRYAEADTLDTLATLLTEDLYALTSDKHLVVQRLLPPERDSTPDESRLMRGRQTNFGVEHVQILAGNVGYLNITHFFRPGEARDAIAAAMSTLQNADALILDMRTNAGGSPGTVSLLLSYLFETPGTLLFEIVSRSADDRSIYMTEAVPHHDGSRPVLVLTSERTFSAGEGLAFILQERERAEIVGKATAGAANPGRPYPLNSRLEAVVPNGQVRTAMTGRNWEGAGVTPDVPTPTSDALRVAHIRAIRELLDETPHGSWADRLRQELEQLER